MNEDKVVTDEALEAKYDPFVKEVTRKVKAGKLTKTEADDILIEIGEKIAE